MRKQYEKIKNNELKSLFSLLALKNQTWWTPSDTVGTKLCRK